MDTSTVLVAADGPCVGSASCGVRSGASAFGLSLANLGGGTRGAASWRALRSFPTRHVGEGFGSGKESLGQNGLDHTDRTAQYRTRVRPASHRCVGSGRVESIRV